MKLNKCKHCNYQNERARVLQHENDKHDQFNCLICPKRFKQNAGLVQHMIGKHNRTICEICFKDFTDHRNPIQSLKNHKEEKQGKYHEPQEIYRPERFNQSDLALEIESYDLRDDIPGYWD
ncbi:MAG: hypothetical protein HeimC2_11000 [Candidatus Heimdallarchaeota archaeon LC_2]|nr:MAG: hypothetical protein HeimC2_11000 [Candidatus Heimdallarchaeota archaeon LC_2]